MTTRETVLLGVSLLLVVAFIFMAFTRTNKSQSNENINPTGSVPCNPIDPGFDINGVQNPLCGTPKCDPTRPGYNFNGFPDIDCGFGRKAK